MDGTTTVRCPVCGDDDQRIDLSPQQWVRRVRELEAAIAEGRYVLEHADVPLASVTAEQPIPPGRDGVRFVVRCSGCGWPTSLQADGYHGNASWTPADRRLRDAPDAPPGQVEPVPQRRAVRDRRSWRQRLRDGRARGGPGRR